MSDARANTPRTNAQRGWKSFCLDKDGKFINLVEADFARQLETELATARAALQEVEKDADELHEVICGDKLLPTLAGAIFLVNQLKVARAEGRRDGMTEAAAICNAEYDRCAGDDDAGACLGCEDAILAARDAEKKT